MAAAGILKDIAKELTLLKEFVEPRNFENISRKKRKIYGASGIILDQYAKMCNIDPVNLESLLLDSGFFKIAPIAVKVGFFRRKEVQVKGIRFCSMSELQDNYNKTPKKVINSALSSQLLIGRVQNIISKTHGPFLTSKQVKIVTDTYTKPKIKGEDLYKKCCPDELERYKEEGKIVSPLEKKYYKKVPKGSELYLSNGMVVNSIFSWIKCIQSSSSDVVVTHLLNNDFENWLRDDVRAWELANICNVLSRRLNKNNKNKTLDPNNVRFQLIERLNRTSIERTIFESTIKPLIQKVKRDDPRAVQEATEKLMKIGETRLFNY